jgi:hypothetical protein
VQGVEFGLERRVCRAAALRRVREVEIAGPVEGDRPPVLSTAVYGEGVAKASGIALSEVLKQ